MNKTEALKLVGELAKRSVRSYQAVNGHIRDKHYAEKEDKAARAILAHLTTDEIGDGELNEALGS